MEEAVEQFTEVNPLIILRNSQKIKGWNVNKPRFVFIHFAKFDAQCSPRKAAESVFIIPQCVQSYTMKSMFFYRQLEGSRSPHILA